MSDSILQFIAINEVKDESNNRNFCLLSDYHGGCNYCDSNDYGYDKCDSQDW